MRGIGARVWLSLAGLIAGAMVPATADTARSSTFEPGIIYPHPEGMQPGASTTVGVHYAIFYPSPSPQACQQKCIEDRRCRSWTHHPQLDPPAMCTLHYVPYIRTVSRATTYRQTSGAIASTDPARREGTSGDGLCGISLGSISVTCSGSTDRCSCATAANSCPYPISVKFQISGEQFARSINLQPAGSSDAHDKVCAARDSSQIVQYQGWQPHSGYPKPGQPRPRRD